MTTTRNRHLLAARGSGPATWPEPRALVDRALSWALTVDLGGVYVRTTWLPV